MDRLVMKTMREGVDEKYVGFHPNGSSVKPVHISGGAFRTILGKTFTAKGIKTLSYVCNASGEAPKKNNKKQSLEEALEDVIKYLQENNTVDNRISKEQLVLFRGALQKLVNVDKGVYGTDDGMLSYTAGSSSFVVGKSMYEDAGEFVGTLIKLYCPDLAAYIATILKEAQDPISLVFEPVRDFGDERDYDLPYTEYVPLDKIEAFKDKDSLPPQLRLFVDNLNEAGKCLKANLEVHPNRLTQIRLFNHFCILTLIRYLSMLEAFYCDGSMRPILLDFSNGSNSSISRTSVLCYSQLHKSISRFYAWAYAEWMKEDGCNKAELLSSDIPYFEKDKKPKDTDGLESLWNIAKEDATAAPEEDTLLIFGAAINDMTALEASSNPVNYMRKLGTEVGFLHPPTNLHVDKRFVLSDDLIEVILRCCVLPGQTLPSTALRKNLWDRFGIVIGGGDDDEEKLNNLGSIVYADTDVLAENWNEFTMALQNMNFAEQLPDGILQIGFGGIGA